MDVDDDLDGVLADWDREEISDIEGDSLRFGRPDATREREDGPAAGTSSLDFKLCARCLDAKVELYNLVFVGMNGPDTDLFDGTVDVLLDDRLRG